jgi:hypothetical protein
MCCSLAWSYPEILGQDEMAAKNKRSNLVPAGLVTKKKKVS